MATNFIQEGSTLTFIAPVGGVVSGGAYLIGATFGVAVVSAAAGAEFALAVSGVFTLPKAATVTPAPGAKLYWDATNSVVTTTSTSNTLIGVHAGKAAAGASDATLPVRLGIVA